MPTVPSVPSVPRLIDLSHRIQEGMPSYPGLPEPQLGTVLTHAQSAERGVYAPGVTFQMASYAIGGNTGTYVDAPFHRHPAGADLADVPLERLADLPGVVVDGAPDGPSGPALFQAAGRRRLAGKAVLVRTGWARHWGTDGYFRSGPFLPAESCELLVRWGVALVGIDCANIDDMSDRTRPAHTILLAAGIPIVEHLRGLELLGAADHSGQAGRAGQATPGAQRGRPFRFFALPPAIAGGTSFPVRALAVLR